MSSLKKFAEAVDKLALAVDRQTQLLEVLIEGMKPSTEAALLKISVRSVSRRRQHRANQRAISG